MDRLVTELRPEDFTERFYPIIDEVLRRGNMTDRHNPKHFFPYWQQLMRSGFARIWEAPGAILGGLFHPDIFNGRPQALIVFWHSAEELKHPKSALALFETFMAAAKARGCEYVATSAYAAYGERKYEAMKRLLRVKGFYESETVFKKKLNDVGNPNE